MLLSYKQDYRLVRSRNQVFAICAGCIAVVVLPRFVGPQVLELANRAMIAAIAAVALNLLTGTCGQISIGHAGFLALGGLVAAIMSHAGWIPFSVILLSTILAGGLVGLVVGLPAVRLRGLYLVLATLAFYYLFLYGIRAWQSTLSSVVALTGLALPPPDLGFMRITSIDHWYYFLGVILLITTLFSINLLRSRVGRAWIAVRDNELVAAAMGINVPYQKLAAFTITSAMASFAGGLLAYYNGTFSADLYTVELSIVYFVMIILGGLGSVGGAILGAVFVTVISPAITGLVDVIGVPSAIQVRYVVPLELVLYGALIIAILLFWPLGLVAIYRQMLRFFTTWPLGYSLLSAGKQHGS